MCLIFFNIKRLSHLAIYDTLSRFRSRGESCISRCSKEGSNKQKGLIWKSSLEILCKIISHIYSGYYDFLQSIEVLYFKTSRETVIIVVTISRRNNKKSVGDIPLIRAKCKWLRILSRAPSDILWNSHYSASASYFFSLSDLSKYQNNSHPPTRIWRFISC